jgi:hypothetical protein
LDDFMELIQDARRFERQCASLLTKIWTSTSSWNPTRSDR